MNSPSRSTQPVARPAGFGIKKRGYTALERVAKPVGTRRDCHALGRREPGNQLAELFAGQRRKPHAFDQLVLLAVGVDFAGDGGDCVHGVAVLQIVVGFDFDFLVGRARAARVVDHPANVVVQLEKRLVALVGLVAQLHACKLAIGRGAKSHLEQGRFAGLAQLAGRVGGHPDVEVSLGQHDFEGKHEEHQQLEHDVNHRRHLQDNMLAMFGVTETHEVGERLEVSG